MTNDRGQIFGARRVLLAQKRGTREEKIANEANPQESRSRGARTEGTSDPDTG
jgi:hypothetical protein